MKKLFKYILNKVPRPLLIRLSYIVKPILALVLKGNTYTDPIDGATHYHATYVSPKWAGRLAKTKQIGIHIFYKHV